MMKKQVKMNLRQIINHEMVYVLDNDYELDLLLKTINESNHLHLNLGEVTLKNFTDHSVTIEAKQNSKQYTGSVVINYKTKTHLINKLFIIIAGSIFIIFFAFLVPISLKYFDQNKWLLYGAIIGTVIGLMLVTIAISIYPVGIGKKEKTKIKESESF